jgi:hypothetical protein
MLLLEVALSCVPVIYNDIPENREVMQEHAFYFSSGNVDHLVA